MLKHTSYTELRKEGALLVSHLLGAYPDQIMKTISPYDLSVKSAVNEILTYDKLQVTYEDLFKKIQAHQSQSHAANSQATKDVLQAYKQEHLLNENLPPVLS